MAAMEFLNRTSLSAWKLLEKLLKLLQNPETFREYEVRDKPGQVIKLSRLICI